MRRQNLVIAGIEDRRFIGATEEVVGVSEKILVEGVRKRDQDDQRLAPTATHPTAPLPRAGDAAGIPDQKAGVQSAYVDSEFQGGGGNDPRQLFAEQPPLN